MTSLFCRKATAFVLLAAAVVCPGSGCKKATTVTVTGSVVRNGQTIALGPNGYIEVTLQPDLPPDAPFTPKLTECDKSTGKFEIRDVTPGKYRIGVRQLDPDPTNDKLNGALRADTGKIVRDIDGKQPVDIDLAKLK